VFCLKHIVHPKHIAGRAYTQRSKTLALANVLQEA